ncbi:SUMF1/EgtB/PvdO family nonheme iron enzyme [Nonomuraea sp. NPDC049709]|uniref:SUMF1/EgtB/PvdO family nonheme iron enzyme n=1 Tax=Nonomuraea sp. NPDC049709 TaxID=3154736 RepID=UPI00341FE4CC
MGLVEVQSRTTALLSKHPSVGRQAERRALLLTSGLDQGLLAQVSLEGTPFTFLAQLIDTLTEYGELTDGRDALTAFLEACKRLFGVDGQQELDQIIALWAQARQTQGARSPLLTSYLRHLVDRWRTAGSPLLPEGCTFSEVAIQLRVTPVFEDRRDEGGRLSREAAQEPAKERKDIRPSVDLLTLLEETSETERWLLLGDPGTGKTTLALQESARLAERAAAGAGGPVPVFVSLANLAQRAAGSAAYSLYEYISALGQDLQLPGLDSEVRKLARRGEVMFLLDGADEVPESLRDSVMEMVNYGLYAGSGNRVLITSRRVGAARFTGYRRLDIAPFTVDDQRNLLMVLCGPERTRVLLAEITGRAEVREMARVPMMLTVLGLVARESEHVALEPPGQPGISATLDDYFRRHSDLFRLAVRILLEGRHRSRRSVADPYAAEQVLAGTSLLLHDLSGQRGGEETFRDIQIEAAVRQAGGEHLAPWRGPREFIDDVSAVSNIIHPVDALRTRYRYLHRTVREFLAALELSLSPPDERRRIVGEVVNEQHWAEVLILLGGLVSDVDDHLMSLLQGPPDLALRALKEVNDLDPGLAAQILELRPTSLRNRRQIFVELARKLPDKSQLMDTLWAYLEAAGEHIPRVDVYFIRDLLSTFRTPLADQLANEAFKHLGPVPEDLFTMPPGMDAPYWCHLPAGSFVMGGAEDDEDRPEWVPVHHEVVLPEMWIGRVLVTNEMYERFDRGHRAYRPFQDDVDPRELDHHPVVDVSWYEAKVFCDWAAQRFPNVRLPSEYEWEKAASWNGSRKFRFPWGDEWDPARLNSWERGPNRTTRVGDYPAGASPCGALDMAGNVWEWCLDWFVDDLSPELGYQPAVAGDRRVDRGGGWYHDVGRPCTFMRAADAPSDSFSHCGFRLLVCAARLESGLDIGMDLSG